MAYTQEQRELAVAIVRRLGYTRNALDEVEHQLGKRVSKSVLYSWVSAASATEPNRTEPNRTAPQKKELVTADGLAAAEKSLDTMFEETVRAYLTRANHTEAINDTKGKDAVIAAATALDKLRLIRGLPTEIIQVLPAIVTRLDQLGLSASGYFDAMLQELDRAYRDRVDQGGA